MMMMTEIIHGIFYDNMCPWCVQGKETYIEIHLPTVFTRSDSKSYQQITNTQRYDEKVLFRS